MLDNMLSVLGLLLPTHSIIIKENVNDRFDYGTWFRIDQNIL